MTKRNAKHPRKKLLDTRTPDTKACIFCSRRDTTREHIFSQWTHKHMLPRGTGRADSILAIALPDRTEYVQTKMRGEMRDWQIKCVCGGDKTSCNNGWMRTLDEAADPILTPLILGRETRLSEADQRIIAAWAVLKVMVADHKRVHHAQRKQFKRTHRPPAGWTVWIGHFERTAMKFEWMSRPFPVLREAVLARRKSKVTLAANANATTQIIKHLFIHVAHTPNPAFGRRWQFIDAKGQPLSGSLPRIWPTSGVSIKWPPPALNDRDAAIAANSIWEAVQQRARMERGFSL
jgi:hypothetical protein